MKRGKHEILLYTGTRGGGWVDCLDVPEGQSVKQLFEERMAGQQPEHFVIRVNRQPVSLDTVLQEGDRVAIVPLETDGART
jgi:sulfur carrier protein ThiS